MDVDFGFVLEDRKTHFIAELYITNSYIWGCHGMGLGWGSPSYNQINGVRKRHEMITQKYD